MTTEATAVNMSVGRFLMPVVGPLTIDMGERVPAYFNPDNGFISAWGFLDFVPVGFIEEKSDRNINPKPENATYPFCNAIVYLAP